MLSGFINLYKPLHITSNKALSVLKRALIQNNISTKIGHFGTLDPEAEGVLPVALGRATRLFDYSIGKTKTYIATFTFGKTTDTLDGAGRIIEADDNLSPISEKKILSIIPSLIGEINQLPPAYSAKSINGVRAYQLAREGIEFELQPKKITIYDIVILEKLSENVFVFKIVCSGGTYIRALARDMASALGTIGYMSALKRTQSGYFTVENSVSLDKIDATVLNNVIPLSEYLADYQIFFVPKKYTEQVKNGVKLQFEQLPDGIFQVYVNEELLGLGFKNNEGYLDIKTWLI